VRISYGSRALTITLAGDALKALGAPAVGVKCQVYHDANPARPELRLVVHAAGHFVFCQTGLVRGLDFRLVRISRQLLNLGHRKIKRVECPWVSSWEASDGKYPSIDIKLPPALARATSVGDVASDAVTPHAVGQSNGLISR
jgi:hypothetical protein